MKVLCCDMKIPSTSLGFVRTAVVSPSLRVGDVAYNVDRIIEAIDRAVENKCRLIVFPELAITGYTCGDLFHQPLLIREALRGLERIVNHTLMYGANVIVGVPIQVESRLYNCAAFVSHGSLVGLVPKTYLPNGMEFYDRRWFASERDRTTDHIVIDHERIPFGADLLFKSASVPDCVVGIEICEDLWAVKPPSGDMALRGATIIANPSASNEILGKREYRKQLVGHQSARCLAAYLYASSGVGESSTDTVFSGHSMIAENGLILAETSRFEVETQMEMVDIDIESLRNERFRNPSFNQQIAEKHFRLCEFQFDPLLDVNLAKKEPLLRDVHNTPFVPRGERERLQRCEEILSIQASGLRKRIQHIGLRTVVLGLSGGLDSTLALLVCERVREWLGGELDIHCIVMPGFGTTIRTNDNAMVLAELLHCNADVIDIRDSVRKHFENIGHSEHEQDLTFENAQARERTHILMDYAGKVDGIVVGTGDLSELALGWCTFNADHMSMYNVNAGVPKTLVREIIATVARTKRSEIQQVLQDIANTPVSPELLPPVVENGTEIPQSTEDSIGPYEIHDFILYNVLRHQFSPRKIFVLARQAFADAFDDDVILDALLTFHRRFFSQQFKRSTLPDGPKIGSVALSPRADWRMPSDASAALWLTEINNLQREVAGSNTGEAQ